MRRAGMTQSLKAEDLVWTRIMILSVTSQSPFNTEDVSEYLQTVYTPVVMLLGLWMCSLRSM